MNLSKTCTSILFLFFTITTAIGQNIETILPTLEIDTILNNGPKENRINIAFANISNANSSNILYNSKNELINSVTEILTYFDYNHLNAKSGYSQYRNFFNVQSVWFPETLKFAQVAEFYQIAQGIRDALFLPWADDQHGWTTMIYSGAEGNGAGVVREKRVGDIYMGALNWETVLHEFGHTMPGLYDEYTASGSWSNYVCSEGPNVTGQNVIDEVPWRKWIEQDTPLPTPYENSYFNQVGLFEGNISGYFGCYRPTAKSCYMGAGGFGEGFGQEMCSVCLQRFITMLYKYVNVIENPLPASPQIEINGSTTISFSADIIKPEPNTQKYEWFVNGKLVETAKESIDINFDACDKYVVDLVVTDTTDAVRFDEKFKDIYPEPKQKYTWYVDQSAVSSYNLSVETLITPADCNGIENGKIVVTTSGGLAPYNYSLNGKIQDASIFSNLSAGIYNLVVSDANGCSIIKELEITQDALLDFELCSSYLQGSWELSASLLTEENGELTYLWSNGSSNDSILVNTLGIYNLKITNSTGCVVQREILLSEVLKPLEVTQLYANSVAGLNNGAIYLELNGGLEPYDITWYKGQFSDLTYLDANKVISSGNGEFEYHLPKFAFDNDLSFGYDFWAETFTGNNYLGFDFEEITEIEAYSITSNVDVKERDAKSWVLQGSNNGQNWVNVQSISGFEFPERLETFEFNLESPASYRFFRLLFSENWGGGFDGWIAIQQIEFGIFVNEEIKQFKNKRDIQGLAAGFYSYAVKDLNNSCKTSSIKIENIESVDNLISLNIIQDGNYKVKVAEPNSSFDYYWSNNNDGSGLLNIASYFQPTSPGQYFVRSFDKATNSFNSKIKGFSVTMDIIPEVETLEASLKILNPKANYTYYWYNVLKDGDPIHTGVDFYPDSNGQYYVSAKKVREIIDPINPNEIGGIKLWMDTSDLDGNGIADETLANSSAYKWQFRAGGEWRQDGWFPYRSNYQNGLGIVDFSTMWFQYVNSNADKMRTMILVYQESDFSPNKSAPFYNLKESIPRHSDATQLFSNDAPQTTLNGKTYLNGKLVNPLTEDNPMDFVVLSVVFTDLVNGSPSASDEYWEGKLGELITWDIALSDVQIKGVNEFLKKKWLSTADLESPRVSLSWGSNVEIDDDSDGVMNNLDTCSNTPTGETVNLTGCSQSQIDDDGDGVMNNIDTCPNTPTGESVNAAGCSQSQIDDDGDGVMNDKDLCPNTASGTNVNANGCFFLPANNFSIEVIGETCPNKNNGKISISAQATHNYIATINGTNYNFSNNSLSVSNLAPGNYNVCIKITGITFEQCFTITIAEGKTVSGKSSVTSNKTSIDISEGTGPYNVSINGINVLSTISPSFMLDVKHGDLVEVKTAVLCEGVFSKTIDLFENIKAYPNPTKGIFEITLPISVKEVAIELFTVGSQLISKATYQVVNGKVQINLENKPTGVYVVKINLDTPVSLTIIKE